MLFNRRIPSWYRVAYHYDSLGAVSYGIFYGFVIAFLLVTARKIGASNAQIALVSSSVFIASLLSYLWLPLITRFHPMRILVIVKTLGRTLFLLMFWVKTPLYFVLLVVIYWILEIGVSPSYLEIIKAIYPENDRGRTMGLVRVEMVLAIIISTYLAGWLLDKVSYRVIFPLGTLFGVFSLHFFRKIPLKNSREEKRVYYSLIFRDFVSIIRNNHIFRYYLTSISLLGAGALLSFPLYTIYLVDVMKISNFTAGKIGTCYSIFWLVSYFIWGKVSDVKSPFFLMLFAFLVTPLVPFLYFVSRSLLPVYVAAIVTGLNTGAFELGRLGINMKLSARNRVQSYFAVDNSLMGIRGCVFPYIGTALSQWITIKGVFFLSAFLTSFAAARFSRIIRRKKLL